MKRFFLVFTLTLLAFCGYSQSAQKLTEVLSSEEVTYGNASWFIALQSGLIEDTQSEADALNALSENGYFKSGTPSADDKIPLQDFSLLCTKTYGIKGGLLYRITKAPRYAVRELKAMRIVPNEADSHSSINGRQMLNILSACEYEKTETSNAE